jgi:hypothetical protein
MNSYSYHDGPWGEWTRKVDELMASYDAPDAARSK